MVEILRFQLQNDGNLHFLDDALLQFQKIKALGDKTFAQLDDADFLKTLDAESNSIAIIIKHLHGNMLSRWTDFLTSDGEKPNRNRDSEFETDENFSKEHFLKLWKSGWDLVLKSVSELREDDVLKTITIRGEEFTVVQAINRQLSHYSYHVGQIVFLAKHLRSESWQTLSIGVGKARILIKRPKFIKKCNFLFFVIPVQAGISAVKVSRPCDMRFPPARE